MNSRANFDLITYSYTVSLSLSLFDWLCLALTHTSLQLRNMKTHAHSHIPRRTYAEGIQLNNSSHISAETHSTVVLRSCHDQSICAAFVFGCTYFFIYFFYYSLLVYSGVGTFLVGTQERV